MCHLLEHLLADVLSYLKVIGIDKLRWYFRLLALERADQHYYLWCTRRGNVVHSKRRATAVFGTQHLGDLDHTSLADHWDLVHPN